MAASVAVNPHSQSRAGMCRKFMPKMPVMNVRGMKTAEKTASTYMIVLVRLLWVDKYTERVSDRRAWYASSPSMTCSM